MQLSFSHRLSNILGKPPDGPYRCQFGEKTIDVGLGMGEDPITWPNTQNIRVTIN
jgi:hypothetical protein